MNEADIMRLEQMKASERGDRLFRNNCGVLMDKRGIPVRFGLFTGSGDLIGWTRVTVTEDMIGQTLAVFTSKEIKTKTGKVRPEQEVWRDNVLKAGGIAEIIFGP